MSDRSLQQAALESFTWDSDVQKEGFLNLIQYWRKFGLELDLPLTAMHHLTALYFIQKDHESNEYWQEMVGDQISSLTLELKKVQNECRNLAILADQMKETIRNQTMLLEQLTKK